MKTYEYKIIRIVREVYFVDAPNKKVALDLNGAGDPSSVSIVRETVIRMNSQPK